MTIACIWPLALCRRVSVLFKSFPPEAGPHSNTAANAIQLRTDPSNHRFQGCLIFQERDQRSRSAKIHSSVLYYSKRSFEL